MSPNTKIKTFTPEGDKIYKYVEERNENLAKLIAGIYNLEYIPSNINAKNAYLLLNTNINETTYYNLGNPRFYGCVCNSLHSLKIIFHTPLANAAHVPDNYPYNFSETLKQKGLVLPGFSVFSYEDLRSAFSILDKEKGYVTRIKNPIQENGEGHTILRSDKELEAFIDSHKNILNINENGLVIEANVLNPVSLSVGITEILGEKYFYVGEQTFEQIGAEKLYSGTKLYLSRNKENLKNYPNLIDTSLVKMLDYIDPVLSLIPGLKATRKNFDVIYGGIESLDGQISPFGYYFLEQSFRPGGASGAELRAIEKIKRQNIDVATGECMVIRDLIQHTIPGSYALYKGIDPTYGYLNVLAF